MKIRNQHLSLLALTLSIQGVPIVGQLLAALFVGPTILGEIRWLESVFSILLLGTSCGMPSLVFRNSAMLSKTETSLTFVVQSIFLTSIISIILFFVIVCISLVDVIQKIPTPYFNLLLISTSVIPANAIRILIAYAQGAELTQRVYIKVSIFSSAYTIALSCLAFLFDATGWVATRLVLEFVLFVLVWRLLSELPTSSFSLEIPTVKGTVELGAKGLAPNYAFLIRALADNLPVLLLYNLVSADDEVGLYSFATLLIFAPMLLLSTVMQAELPKLIQFSNNRVEFSRCCRQAGLKLSAISAIGVVSMVFIGFALQSNHHLDKYSGSVMPLFLLVAALPARAFLLLAGGAVVARGWFKISSVISISEILIIIFAIFSGFIYDATSMALGVMLSTWGALFPAFFLLQSSRNI